MGLSLSPIAHKCRRRVLCPVRRPTTTLDLVMLDVSGTVSLSKTLEDVATLAVHAVVQILHLL